MDRGSRAAVGQGPRNHRAAWAVGILLAIIFIPAGALKLIAHESAVAAFESWGYPTWFMYAVGGFELLAGILVLVPRTATYACTYLVIEMVGALVTHLVNAEWLFLLVPVVLGAAAGYLAWSRVPDAAGSQGPTRPAYS